MIKFSVFRCVKLCVDFQSIRLKTKCYTFVLYCCHGIGDGYGGQAGATIEGRGANRGNGIGDGYRGQSSASIERIVANRGHRIADGH